MNIIAIGDSLTYGFDVSATSGWLARIQRERPNWHIHNLGICGDSLKGICLRLSLALRTINPDLVFIMGGTNDLLIYSEQCAIRPMPLPDLITPLVESIRKLQDKHIAYLIGAPPLITQDSVFHGWQTRQGWSIANQSLRQFGDILRVRFSHHVIPFVDALRDPHLYEDGVHPNIHGYAEMAKIALPYFDSCRSDNTFAK